MLCWKCLGKYLEKDVEVVDKRVCPEAVQISWRCPDDGVLNHWRLIDRASGEKYLAVFTDKDLVVPSQKQYILDALEEAVEKVGATCIVTSGGRGDRFLMSYMMRIVVDLPFTIKESAISDVLSKMPRDHIIEHPEWRSLKHPIYRAMGDWNPMAPQRMRTIEMVTLAHEVLILVPEGGENADWVRDAIGICKERKREVVVKNIPVFKPEPSDYIYVPEISFQV